jgi:hypothetical protein
VLGKSNGTDIASFASKGLKLGHSAKINDNFLAISN